jgi:hypothetical protein
MKENKKETMLQYILFRVIKFISIAYVSILFFIVGYFFGTCIDYFCSYLFGKNFNQKPILYLILEVLFQIILICIFAYIGRNIVQRIPFPLDETFGFIHKNLKELNAVGFINIFIYSFQYYMQDKLAYIKNKRENSEENNKNNQNREKQESDK